MTIADLYPDLTPEEQEEAEFHLLRYLDVVQSIFNRLVEDGTLKEVLERERLRKAWEKGREE